MKKLFSILFALLLFGQEAHGVDRSIPCNATGPCALQLYTTTPGGVFTKAGSISSSQVWIMGSTSNSSSALHTFQSGAVTTLKIVSPNVSGNDADLIIDSATTGQAASQLQLAAATVTKWNFASGTSYTAGGAITGGDLAIRNATLGNVGSISQASGMWFLGPLTGSQNANVSFGSMIIGAPAGGSTSTLAGLTGINVADDTHFFPIFYNGNNVTGGTIGAHVQYAANKAGSGIHGWGVNTNGDMLLGTWDGSNGLLNSAYAQFSRTSTIPGALTLSGGLTVGTADTSTAQSLFQGQTFPIVEIKGNTGSAQLKLTRTGSGAGAAFIGVSGNDVVVGTSAGGVQMMNASATTGVMIHGDTTAGSPSAGYVGEVIDCTGSVTPASLNTGNLCSMALTPGNWEVSCSVAVSGQTGLVVYKLGLNSVSANMPTVDAKFANQLLANGTANVGGTLNPVDIKISSSTTYFCVYQPNGATAGGTGYGHARRVR